ncbi:NlpC/P60 family protein [Streptomyces sp. NPDC002044]|uniref:C40 family peptidase n=1 Tax=Streptomyces sp. NPDC002044 TaxID=3154662 RepID=UPI0033263343
MASHRKPRQRPFSGGTVRTAATLALAGAATATAFEGTSQADPRPTPAQVEAEVNRLYEEAEAATERYNGAKEQADEAERALTGLREETARRTDRLNTARGALGTLAAGQYRGGSLGTAVRLALSSDPQEYLAQAAFIARAGDRNAAGITAVRRGLDEVGKLRTQAAGRVSELRAKRDELAGHKAEVQAKLAAASRQLARLSAEERAAYEARTAAVTATATAAPAAASAAAPARRAAPAQAPADGSRAARAVAFAYGAIGKPYVWGATGPGSFDCSGLTQAAWRSAGVSLPRTTYTQINAGRRVSRDQLAPGDLVFFYSGITHVGMYIGNGQMIHAPRPGSTVRVAPLDSMPWAGASRPA